MSRLHFVLLPFLLVPFVSAACGDDETTGVDPNTVTVSGRLAQTPLTTALAEASVCPVKPAGDCVLSDGDGNYSVRVPKNTRVELEIKRDGYASGLVVWDIGDSDLTGIDGGLFTEGFITSAYADAGLTLDLAKGHVAFVLNDDEGLEGGAANYTASLSPSGGEGPFYAADTTIEPTATTTLDGGVGAFINLDDGDYTLSTSGKGACNAAPAWAGDAADAFPAPVRAGFITYVLAECPDDQVMGSGGAGAGGGGQGGAGGGS